MGYPGISIWLSILSEFIIVYLFVLLSILYCFLFFFFVMYASFCQIKKQTNNKQTDRKYNYPITWFFGKRKS